MDVVEFGRDEIEEDWGDGPGTVTVVTMFINGTELRVLVGEPERESMLQRWETEAALRELYDSRDEFLDPRNHQDFLDVSDVAPPSRHWLGEPEPTLEEQGRAAVLTCTCRAYGCGGTSRRITIENDVVTWDEFRHANSWRVVPIGPFNFDRASYEAALAVL